MIDDCDAMDESSLCHDCRELRFRALVRLALSLARDDAILRPEPDVRLARTYGRCLGLVDAYGLGADPEEDLDDFIADDEDEDEVDPDED